MTSNLKIIRMFLEANETNKEIKIDKNRTLGYRNFQLYRDIVLVYPGRNIYILETAPQDKLIFLSSLNRIKIDNIDEFKTSEDLELILKYGRNITDEYIIKILREEYKIELTIKDFESILTKGI